MLKYVGTILTVPVAYKFRTSEKQNTKCINDVTHQKCFSIVRK